MSDIVQKLWGFCHTLRHDGMDYGDYIEQLTYLLFLKMADERGAMVPKGCDWDTAQGQVRHGADRSLRRHPAQTPRSSAGMLGDIFAQATPRFNNPVNLKRVIAMIDEEDWSAMDVDVKGAAFEGLLEKAASEGKKGAGQYFTPRPLIQTICPRDETRPARETGLQDLRSGLRHGRLSCLQLRMADLQRGFRRRV